MWFRLSKDKMSLWSLWNPCDMPGIVFNVCRAEIDKRLIWSVELAEISGCYYVSRECVEISLSSLSIGRGLPWQFPDMTFGSLLPKVLWSCFDDTGAAAHGLPDQLVIFSLPWPKKHCVKGVVSKSII